MPLVLNLTGSVWFFVLVGKAREWFFFFSSFSFQEKKGENGFGKGRRKEKKDRVCGLRKRDRVKLMRFVSRGI